MQRVQPGRIYLAFALIEHSACIVNPAGPTPSELRRQGRAALALALRALAVFLVMAQICIALWFRQKFGKVELDQILFHLQQGSSNVLYADQLLVWSGIKNCLLGPLLYTGVLMALAARTGATRRRLGGLLLGAPVLALAVAGSAAFAVSLTVTFPPSGIGGQDWIALLYRAPPALQAPRRKRNLVLIYGESLEFSYEAKPFGGGLLDPLEHGELAQARSFAHFRQLAGTGWTIAGMVASQCGLPLKPLGIFGGNRFGDDATQFLPNARCLGDVLHASGYRNVFLGGASTSFAGKGMFLRSHGYQEVVGREEWLRRNPGLALNEWGIYDDDLFAQALRKLGELARAGGPFNLTILTVGMHPPDGFLAPSCPVRFGDLRDSVACTAHLIDSFLAAARKGGYLRDTDVVVLGDHLSQQNSQTGRLEQSGERSVFNKLLTASPLPANRSDIDHFDLAPTILSALGYRLPGGRFGLGCSALGPVSCRTLADDPLADAKLDHSSVFYNALWLPAGPAAAPTSLAFSSHAAPPSR
ncbi:sulfatase-like hydrolase/transferase [Caenimonas terrae]|uniref:Sulfatase-like hydrolase/transferase n=1 Tax=Caenimonas terrae TaxID=696074 RepID=A0ABW0NHB2_9BURK